MRNVSVGSQRLPTAHAEAGVGTSDARRAVWTALEQFFPIVGAIQFLALERNRPKAPWAQPVGHCHRRHVKPSLPSSVWRAQSYSRVSFEGVCAVQGEDAGTNVLKT